MSKTKDVSILRDYILSLLVCRISESNRRHVWIEHLHERSSIEELTMCVRGIISEIREDLSKMTFEERCQYAIQTVDADTSHMYFFFSKEVMEEFENSMWLCKELCSDYSSCFPYIKQVHSIREKELVKEMIYGYTDTMLNHIEYILILGVKGSKDKIIEMCSCQRHIVSSIMSCRIGYSVRY